MIRRDSEEVRTPSDFSLSRTTLESLSGGETIEESARIFTDVLENKGTEPQREVVLANAGTALSVGKGISMMQGIDQARESIESGKALQSFKKFIEING